MPPIVFALVACAAVMHATWNVILKAGGDPLRTSGRLNIASVAVGVPAAIVAWVAIDRPAVPIEAIGLAVVSGFLEFLYFVFLSAAYRRGELSVVYPIARGSAPLLAVLAGVVILGERLGILGAAGVAALAAGILVLQRPWMALRTGAVRLSGIDRAARGGPGSMAAGAGAARTRASTFALATGVVIASYSAVDRVGARLTEPWLYAAMLFSVCTVLLVGWIRFLDGGGHAPTGQAHRDARPEPASWPAATAAGLVSTGAYLLVLAAYTLAPLSVVAPLRESAVILVSGWGSFRMGEAANRGDAARRLAGAALVLVGALLLALE